jgi:Uma2 family endonuclease
MSTITQPITVDEYDRMVEDGTIGEDDQVELWDGVVVPKMAKNPPHRVGTTKTVKALGKLIPSGWYVSKEDAVVLGSRSKPEPDAAVIRAELENDSTRDATAADCCLVVEVADKSLADDRGKKLRGYGRAGIPVYWIVNVRDNQVELYTDPDPAPHGSGLGGYRSRVDYRPGDEMPVVIDGQEVGMVPVTNLLP